MINKKEIEELEKIKKIVERCNFRKDNNKSILPKFKNNIKPENRTEEEKQEDSDANKLSLIRKSYIQYTTGIIKEKERHYTYYQSVINYLDEHIPNWKEEKKIEDNKEKEKNQMDEIIELVNRCNERKKVGLNILPKYRIGVITTFLSEDEKIQGADADKLYGLSSGKTYLYESVKKYLDENLEGWNQRTNYKDVNITSMNIKKDNQLNDIISIVERALLRNSKGLNKYPKSKINKVKRQTENEELYKERIVDETQQSRDYDKLSKIKNKKIEVFDVTIEYLDKHLPEWNK